MAAKLRPPKSYHDPCWPKRYVWPKPAAVSFSGVLDGALVVRELEEELIDLPGNPALDDRLLAPADPT